MKNIKSYVMKFENVNLHMIAFIIHEGSCSPFGQEIGVPTFVTIYEFTLLANFGLRSIRLYLEINYKKIAYL